MLNVKLLEDGFWDLISPKGGLFEGGEVHWIFVAGGVVGRDGGLSLMEGGGVREAV